MCRMIAAVGELKPALLRQGLLLMAENCNLPHVHERTPLAEKYRHEDGWGAAWMSGGELRHVRSPRSCLTDPEFSRLDDIHTNLILLHARRASCAGTNALENTHPFVEERNGRRYAFCHNGTVYDLDSIAPADGWKPAGNIDSELLAHHVISHLDERDLERSVLHSLEAVQDYSSLHSLLACERWILAITKRHPQKSHPGYHALWEGRGPNLHVVSTEPMPGVGCTSWARLAEPGVVKLQVRD